ncbi:MAG: T9SS C-terminal target domain-containing protein, partial [Flavobacteriaceae bacterium]|nr:T9SS C-terminal target domain-containing protein [Flavobacteriaceae bacterium]
GNMDREASVNVANLASGVYLVQLEAEGATAIKRLIKE